MKSQLPLSYWKQSAEGGTRTRTFLAELRILIPFPASALCVTIGTHRTVSNDLDPSRKVHHTPCFLFPLDSSRKTPAKQTWPSRSEIRVSVSRGVRSSKPAPHSMTLSGSSSQPFQRVSRDRALYLDWFPIPFDTSDKSNANRQRNYVM